MRLLLTRRTVAVDGLATAGSTTAAWITGGVGAAPLIIVGSFISVGPTAAGTTLPRAGVSAPRISVAATSWSPPGSAGCGRGVSGGAARTTRAEARSGSVSDPGATEVTLTPAFTLASL